MNEPTDQPDLPDEDDIEEPTEYNTVEPEGHQDTELEAEIAGLKK